MSDPTLKSLVAGFIVNNQQFIDSLEHSPNEKKQIEHVEPHRLVMISLNHCDYTGYLDDCDKGIMIIGIPYDNLCGVTCRKDIVDHAKKDVYTSCMSSHIYPIHDDTPEKMGFSKFVSIKRSNGEIQQDWEIIVKNPTCSIDGLVYINVHCVKMDIKKSVALEELCQLNKIDYNGAKNVLVENLKKWYKQDNTE